MRSLLKWSSSHVAGLVVVASGCAAMFMCAVGCNREPDAATTKSSADPRAKAAAAAGDKTADASSDLTDEQIVASVLNRDAQTGPPPKFEKYQDVTIQWDVPASADAKDPDKQPQTLYKTPRSRQHTKFFSDGSTKKDGKYEEWYPNGQKLQEGEYVDDVRQGPWKLWHENGKPCKTENYLNGKLEGTWKTFSDRGLLEMVVSYHDGVRNGRWISYGPDGKTPTRQEEYKAGAIDGEWIYYFADGKVGRIEHFKNGKRDGELITKYPNGKDQLVQHYVDDQLHGKESRYLENGKLAKEIDWDRGQMVSNSQSGSAGK
jgi:antitoxin component YwqK of YwqJK toxin-antitoxin module